MQKSFLYANGVVASLTGNIVTKESFHRMIEAKTNTEALSVLQETNFASGVVIETPFQIEELLGFETKKLLNFIKQESPLEELIYYFCLPYDYNNISAYCKNIVLGQDANNFIEAEGMYELSKIKELITTKNFDGFNNKHIKSALLEFQVLASKPNINGNEVDFLFKKYLYDNLKESCKKNSITKLLVETNIDIENLSTAMRASTQYHFEQQLLCGGTLESKTLQDIFKRSKDTLTLNLNPILTKFVKLALSENKEKSFIEFEKLKNTYPLSLLENKKNDIDSIGPFADYIFRKQIEIKNIRLIMSYHNNNLSEYIKKRYLES